MDIATVQVNYSGKENVTLFAISDVCWECDLAPRVRNDCTPETENCIVFSSEIVGEFNFSSHYPVDMELRKASDNTTVLWKTRTTFDERAGYQLNVSDTSSGVVANYAKIKEGSTTVILFVILALIIVWMFTCCGMFVARKKKATALESKSPGLQEEMLVSHEDACESTTQLPQQVQDVAPVAPKRERVVCLDVFRGIDLFAMIFCNQGGGGWWFFEHAAWNGLTPPDFIFPWFAFIMGVTMNIGMASHEKKETPLLRILLEVFIRAVKLFLLGLYCNNFKNLTTGRIPGVLQSFGFAYLIVAICILLGRAFQSPTAPYMRRAVEVFAMFVVVLTFLLVTFFLPVEGCPRGYFGPGGDSEHGKYRECLGGAYRVVDRAIFGEKHLYQWGTSHTIYNTSGGWDPEGFMNWFMVAFCTYIGYYFGGKFLRQQEWSKKFYVLMIPGLVLILIALILCGFKVNGGWIPLNKNLWSLSFTLLTSGAGCVVLAILYLVVDKFKFWDGIPFNYNGMNSILLYVGHQTLDQHTPFGIDRDTQSHFENTLVHFSAACIWTFIAYLMYKRKIFFTV